MSYRVLLAEAEIIGLRWALRQGEAREAQFEAALKPLLPLLDTERGDPRVYGELAAIYELKARWRVAGRKGAEEEVARGLEMAGKALALNPRMAAALGVKAGLHVLRAQGARAPEVRAEEARRAKEALAEALRENPLLERELGSTREEIERLLGTLTHP